MEELTESELQELADKIKDGFTSGRIDNELEDGTIRYISWELKTTVWEE